MSKKSFTLIMMLAITLLWGCKKSEDMSTIQKSEKSNSATLAAIGPTSILPASVLPTSESPGARNYESYFVSKADGKIHGYIISIPKDYDPYSTKQYPLLVFLHGVGEIPSTDYDLSKLLINGPQKEIINGGRSFPAVVASIQMAKGEGNFNPAVTKEFIDVLTGVDLLPNKTKGAIGFGKYNIDLNKIHLTGLSLGGNAVYRMAYTYPNLLASISVFSGFTGSQSDMSKIKIPTFIRHNSDDYTISSQNAYNAQKWIDAAGPVQPVYLVVNDGSDHDSWTQEYNRTDAYSVYNWHFSITKGSNSTPVINPSGALSVNSYSPAVNSVAQSSYKATLTLTFNKPVRKATGLIEVKNLTDNTSYQIYANWSMVTVNNDKAIISNINLETGKLYAIRIANGAFTDMDGLKYGGISNDNTWRFSAGTTVVPPPIIPPVTPPIPPVTPPSTNLPAIVTYAPAINGVVAAADNSTLTLQFNKPVNKGQGLIEIKNLTDNQTYQVYSHWGMVTANSDKVTIYPVPLKAGKQYAVRIQEGSFTDQNGNRFAGIKDDNTWRFSVSGGSTTTPPPPAPTPTPVPVPTTFSLSSVYPAGGGSPILRPANGYITITLTFNKTIKKGSGLIKLKNLTDGTEFVANVNWAMATVSGTKCTVYPVPVTVGKKYMIYADKGTFLDDSGNVSQEINNSGLTFAFVN